MSALEFDAREIQCLLPHRYPFLLVDRAFDIVPGVSAQGIKNYSIDAWYFQGHFPSEPIVPGVLLVESLAQLVAIVYVSEAFRGRDKREVLGPSTGADPEGLAARVGYLAKADVKFTRPVRPGDQMTMHAEIVRKMDSLSQVRVVGKVGKVEVVKGVLSVSERNQENTLNEEVG